MKYFILIVLCAFCASANAQFSLNNSSLIAYYPLNGNFLDASGNGHHAVSNGNMTFVNDKWGSSNSAAAFDGIDDFLELPLYDLTKKSFTILFMFRYDAAVQQFLFHKGSTTLSNAHQFSIYHSNPTTLNRLGYNYSFNTTCPGSIISGSINGPGTHTTNTWYCVAYSYQRDSAIMRLHAYGVAAHAFFHVASLKLDTCGAHPLLVGKWTQTSPLFFKGALDEIRIYDSAFLGSTTAVPVPSAHVFEPYCDQAPLLIQPFTDTLQCPGRSFNIGYIGGTFNSGNTITAQLSDASGSFANPVAVGSATTTSTSGFISCTIPLNALPGTGHRIRLVSSNLPQTTMDNGKNIRITAYPTVTATGTSPVCAGGSINLSASGTAGVTHSWSGPSFTSSLQNPVISNAPVTAAGDYIVTATLYTCASKDTVTVIVNPIPAAPIAGSNSPVCPNTPINLTASNVTGASYSWSGPSSYASTQQNPVIANAAAAHAGNYSVTATVNGCTSPAGTTNVVVATPAAPYTAGSNSPVCAGGTLNLTVTNFTSASFSWSGPNGFSDVVQNPSIAPAPLNGSGTYSVYATLNGCQYPAVTTNVVVNNISSLGVYPSPNDTLCINNTSASFVAVPFNAGTSPQYQWYKNNNLIGGATNITYPATGIGDGDSFYCRMTVTGLCADPLVLYSNKLGMTVLPLTTGPSVSITADPGTLLSPWQLVKFTVVATNAGALPKYQWKRNSQDVIGATSDVWSANNLSNGDTISCVATSGLWCASPASEVSNRMVVNIKTGISDIDGGSGMKLYPNPNNGTFTVYLPTTPSRGGHVGVDVIDALGSVIYRDALSHITHQKLEIALPASVANGVYMLKLHAEGVVYHARFTVSR